MKSIVLKSLLFTAIVLMASSATAGKLKGSLKSKSAARQAVTRLETAWNSNGGGDIAFLDRHNIDCATNKAGAISSFHMRTNGGQISYEYQCTDASSIDWGTCATQTTGMSGLGADRKESLNFLDRQAVNCGDGKVLTQFQLKTSSDDWQIQYQYTCCEAVLAACDSKTTSVQDLGVGNLIYLDRQIANVPAGAVMTGFQFQSQYPSRNSKTGDYKINYCMPQLKVTHRNTDWNNNGGGDIFFLDRHNVDCGAGQAGAVTNFHMRRNGSDISYEYDCTMVRSIDFSSCSTKTTSWSDVGARHEKSLNFLDRQNVKCDAGSVLTQFQLKSTSDDVRIRYQYTCCPASVGDCSSKQTSIQDIGDGSLIYLDRQYVSADANTVLSGFQFQSQYGAKVTGNYRVDSCAVKF